MTGPRVDPMWAVIAAALVFWLVVFGGLAIVWWAS